MYDPRPITDLSFAERVRRLKLLVGSLELAADGADKRGLSVSSELWRLARRIRESHEIIAGSDESSTYMMRKAVELLCQYERSFQPLVSNSRH